MQIDHFLNFRRLFLFMRKTLYENFSMTLIAIGAIGIITLIFLIALIAGDAPVDDIHNINFFPLLFLNGIFFTAVIFNDMHDKQRGYTYFSLPVSSLEKLLSSFLLTSFACIIISFILYFIISIAVELFIYLNMGNYIPIFDHFQRGIWIKIHKYFVFHAIVLFSSVYFKKLTLLKLPVALLGLAIVFSFFTFAAIRIVYWDFFYGFFHPIEQNMYIETSPILQNFIIEYFWPIIKFSFWFLLPPFLWLLTYLRIKEKQV